jgi:hypothetical protein
MCRDLNIVLIVHGLPELLVYEDVEYNEEDERDDPVDHQVHVDDVHLRTKKLIVTCVANAVLQYYTHCTEPMPKIRNKYSQKRNYAPQSQFPHS